ncbi:MAG: BamA/TamA family outer membrane protein [Fimbriimonadaceae bacterium]|nr:BamA/TamA family outer membrane protein [Fimbriimonadaceae bacterium]
MLVRPLIAILLIGLVAIASANSTIRSIVVRGNQEVSEAAILAAMRTKQGAPLVPEDLRRDEESIRRLGFFRAVSILTRQATETEVELFVEVSEFPLIKELRITGNTAISTEDLEKLILPIQELGKIWNSRNAAPIRDAIGGAYEKRGFFVQFSGEVEPDSQGDGTLLIRIVEPTVESITLTGLSRTKPETVKRIMRTKPGQAFSITDWRRDMEDLGVTYWFREIKPSREDGDTPGGFKLNLEFTEERTGIFNAGIALDPQSRLVGFLSYNDTNWQGLGQSTGLQLSQATAGGGPSAELAFGNRFYDSKNTQFSARVFSKVIYNFTGGNQFFGGGTTTEEEFNERRTGFTVSFNRPVGQNYRATVGLNARNARTINLRTSANNNNNFIQQDGDLVTLQVGAEYDTSRPAAEPFNGQNFSLLLEPGYSNITRVGGGVGGSQGLLGSNLFLRSTVEYRQYWSKDPARRMTRDNRMQTPEEVALLPRPVFAFRARYVNITGNVPFFEQSFVGGADSLRGYDNQRFWGNQSILATAEYRFPLQANFSLIGFADYGGAWGGYGNFSNFTQSSSPNLKLGYGAGLAFRVPGLGAIRIDFAFNQEGGSRTHFVFGAPF